MGMVFTGERYVPEIRGRIYYEHLHRYMLAVEMARDRDVLDIASGEGYGAAYLALVARSVIGVDIDQHAVRHAAAKYTAMNLSFRVGSCTEIPLGDESVDVVVSFETIEHIAEHERFLAEIRRVLRPQGQLIISSPNKAIYSDRDHYQNPYHVRELYFDEFRDLLLASFPRVRIHGQRLIAGSAIHPLRGSAADARYIAPGMQPLEAGLPALPEPTYFVAVCSRLSMEQDAPLDSIFIDPQDDLFAELNSFVAPVNGAANNALPQPAMPALGTSEQSPEERALHNLLELILDDGESSNVSAAERGLERLRTLKEALEQARRRVRDLEERAATVQADSEATANRLSETLSERDLLKDAWEGLLRDVLGEHHVDISSPDAIATVQQRLREHIGGLEARIAEIGGREQGQVAERDELQRRLTEGDRERDELQRQLMATISERDAQIAELQSINAQYLGALDDVRSVLSERIKERDQFAGRVQELADAHAAATEQIAQLQTEADARNLQLETLRSAQRDAARRVDQLVTQREQEGAELASELADLQRQSDLKHAALRTRNAMRERELEAERDALAEELERARAELADGGRANVAEMERLAAGLAEERRRIEMHERKLEADRDGLEDELNRLRSNAEQARARVHELDEQLALVRRENQKVEDSMSRLVVERDESRAAVLLAQEELTKNRDELQRARAELHRIGTTLHEVMLSKSWKLTKPLRMARRALGLREDKS